LIPLHLYGKTLYSWSDRKWSLRANPDAQLSEQKQPSNDMIPLILTSLPQGRGEQKFFDPKVNVMTWTSPVFEEVVLCCEINSYVSAKL
jgi:hypothetical protein